MYALIHAGKVGLICSIWVVAFFLGLYFRKSLLYLLSKIKNRKKIPVKKEVQEFIGVNPFKSNSESNKENYSIIEDSELTDDTKSRIEKYKQDNLVQVFLVNSELGMGAGKAAAQVGHASVCIYSTIFWEGTLDQKEVFQAWDETNSEKVIYKVNNLQQLKEIGSLLKKQKVYTKMIADAGRTQIKAGSITVLGTLPISKTLLKQIIPENSLQLYDIDQVVVNLPKNEKKEKKEKINKNEDKVKKTEANEKIKIE